MIYVWYVRAVQCDTYLVSLMYIISCMVSAFYSRANGVYLVSFIYMVYDMMDVLYFISGYCNMCDIE